MILFVGRIILAFLEETWKGTGSGWRCDRVLKLAIIFYSEVCWCHILILVKWTWLMICRFHNFYRLGYQWEILQNVIEFTKKELKSETNQNIWYDRCFFEPEPQWFSLLKLNVCNAYEQNIETKCGKWWLVGWHSMLLCSNRANPAFVDVLKRIQPWVRRMSKANFESPNTHLDVFRRTDLVIEVFSNISLRHNSHQAYLIVFLCLSPFVLTSHGGTGQVTGSMQEVTSMLIDKVMGDRCANGARQDNCSTGRCRQNTKFIELLFLRATNRSPWSSWDDIFFHIFFLRATSYMYTIIPLYIWSLWILNITGPGPFFRGKGGGGKNFEDLKRWGRW